MLTTRTRAIVSVAIASLASLAGCAHTPVPSTSTIAMPLTIRFDNEGTAPVRVYLIGDRREWALGRVEPGQHATLRIPEESLTEPSAVVRLAALADAPPTHQAARDPRATFALAQPVSTLSALYWRFTQTQATAAQLVGMRPGDRR